MHLTAPAILVAARPHGETAVIARMLTEESGLVAAYVAGGRGRQLRPVVIPGNLVQADIRAKSDSQLPFARLELVTSRGPWLSEPLPAAAIAWVTALTASVLPERNAYPALYDALGGLLDAICSAQAARQWVEALAVYEALMLRELGYGGERPAIANLGQALEILDRQEPLIARYLLADTRTDVLAARQLLRQRLARMVE
ncbi:recombination protein O N-terminal domain-containing protein [Qipengyuania citrea]|jgi:DNA repair protein RecO (recombination protein O)|uniref:DNA repair protein RecO n=1 Tax=Qipengyuania citrea TaxID=225971 RepID=A0ABY4UCD3_9SPHN|nr:MULTISPECIES: recombination protein O N-terminal domain-containing protein [Qipengyuania]MAG41412.1 DNA recombination protein RecO [Erythrobacteraceae bacterium]MAQ66063.1 DNA recombination protein RecO [Sphingomonadaceae bacterium]MCH2496546.1 recombination protein O N-terminal domain-containing protein [Erythrobacter sp.]MEE2795251.1 recombination protein O N-terminal domain-containing protein [Pseudomonadota bacterium]MBG75000.1 DNA recombination protein RecO [Erythrobacteraceae bacteriu|tara:strand:- start:611 stop:1210 length:600 start_codon:yes stop_codon:yes gene_type:complete